MHRSILTFAVATALVLGGTSSYAMQRGHGGGSPKPPSHAPSPKHGPSTATHGKGGSHGPATKPVGAAKHGTSTTHGSSKHGAAAKTTTSTTKKSTTTTTTTATSSSTGTDPVTLTKVQQKLQRNTKLADKLQSRLPAGTDLMKAAADFKNLGQFVAAVNVSNNLDIKFTDLKTRMVDEGMSLGQAIQDVKATANVATEVKRAEVEADAMIKSTSTTSTSTTTTTTTSTTASKKAAKSKAKPRTTSTDRN